VVDDAREVIDFIVGVLRDAGHEVFIDLDGRELEARIARERPDLVFLDLVLPERNGFQILRTLRREPATRDLPVVVISSKTEATDIEWGMMQGATDYLTKPLTADRLLGLVARHS
jgi:twitching motility two-component system response regulator PilH